MPSKWLEWKPTSDTFGTAPLGANPIIHVSEDKNDPKHEVTKVPKVINTPCGNSVETHSDEIIENTRMTPVPKVPKLAEIPQMPNGVRLVHWDPQPAPAAIDICSVVLNIPKFIKTELQALDSRLNNPQTIHGGFTVPQILDRLAQVGLIVTVEVKRENEKPS